MPDNESPHTLPPTEARCPDCSAAVAGGREGCQALWIELAARAYIDPRYASARDLAFDAYCMQHLDTYCRSGKSYAAHLTRLCCGLEYGGAQTVYFAIQRWLNGSLPIARPEPPIQRGTRTVADALAARDVEEYRALVQAWAADVWAAYSPQHELARSWIQSAMQIRKRMPYPEFEDYET